MQAIGTRLGDELVGDHLVVLSPAMLDHELAQLLRPSQGRLEAVNAAGEVVLALVKYLLLLEHGEYAVLALEGIAGEEEVGKLVDIEVGAVAFLLDELAALGTGGFQGLDPGRWTGHVVTTT